MTPGGGAPGRATRTGAMAAVALAAAAGGHLATGAPALSPPGLLATAVVLTVPAWWLTGEERGWGALAAALLAGQSAAHALFTAFTPTAATGSVHHEAGWLPVDLMLLGHLLAAAVGAVWLRRGERRAWAAARRAAAALRLTLSMLLSRPAPVPVDGGGVCRDARQDRPVPRRAVLRDTIILRGPPLGG